MISNLKAMNTKGEKMKILVPIQNDIDIIPLYKAGASEVYCGYLPEWWTYAFNSPELIQKLGSVPCNLNNRNSIKSNLTDYQSFCRCVSIAEKFGITLYVTLNAKYFPEAAYPLIGRWLNEIIDAGAKRLIVSDFGLISWLCSNYPELQLSISCLSQITNSESVRFLLNFKSIERIVFPRHISVDEAKQIAEEFPNMQFEFFGLSNKCQYDDGFCRGLHDLYPICKDTWRTDYYSVNGDVPTEMFEKLSRTTDKFNRWAIEYPRSLIKQYRWEGVACSLCAISDLSTLPNISTIKLAGRGYELSERIEQVKIASKIINMVNNGSNTLAIRDSVSEFFENPKQCCSAFCIMPGKD